MLSDQCAVMNDTRNKGLSWILYPWKYEEVVNNRFDWRSHGWSHQLFCLFHPCCGYLGIPVPSVKPVPECNQPAFGTSLIRLLDDRCWIIDLVHRNQRQDQNCIMMLIASMERLTDKPTTMNPFCGFCRVWLCFDFTVNHNQSIFFIV